MNTRADMDERIPSEVQELMVRSGLGSLNAVAKAAELHTTTVSRLIIQGVASRPESIERVAGALRVNSEQLLALVGKPAGEIYVGPEASRVLTPRQRSAVDELIRAFAPER